MIIEIKKMEKEFNKLKKLKEVKLKTKFNFIKFK
jgi:hypothetical protein